MAGGFGARISGHRSRSRGVPIPEGLSFEQASVFRVRYRTAHHAHRPAALGPARASCGRVAPVLPQARFADAMTAAGTQAGRIVVVNPR
jgi:hypothetical protein